MITRKILEKNRILLVEDDEINQLIICELLEDKGMTVIVANNGQEALKILEEKEFDLIFMDIQMPIMDGYQATRELRKNSRFQDLPVIAMSGSSSEVDREMAILSGVNECIPKPIEPDQIFSILEKYFNSPVEQKHSTEKKEAEKIEKEKEKEFAKIDGINIQEGLARYSDDEKAYKRILLLFSESYGNSLDEMEAFLERGELQRAKHLAHTVKGSSGVIGAKRLYERMRNLEAAISEKNWKNQLTHAKEEMKKIISALSVLKSEENPKFGEEKDSQSVDVSKIFFILDEMRELMEDDNTKALGYIEILKNFCYPLKIQEDLILLEKTMQVYNFEKALKILSNIKNNLAMPC